MFHNAECHMRWISWAVAAVLLGGAVVGVPVRGQVSLGVGLCYGSYKEEAGLDLRALQSFTREVRGALDFEYFFTGSGTSFWTLDANVHYIFTENRRAGQRIYGIAGLQYARDSGSGKASDSETGKASDSETGKASDSEIGLNIGIGGENRLDFGSLFGEVKYVLGKWDQLVLTAGLRFVVGGAR
jgi:hypothetical protein